MTINPPATPSAPRVPFLPVLASVLLLVQPGCAGRGVPADPAGPSPVALEEGGASAERSGVAADLMIQALEAEEEGRPDDAFRLAWQVVQDFPRTPVSGRAALMVARLGLELGQPAPADRAAGRLAAALPDGDDRLAEVLAIQAGARLALDDPAGAMDRLLVFPAAADSALLDQGRARTREAGSRLGPTGLAAVVRDAPEDWPFRSTARVAWAEALREAGDVAGARREAEAVLEGGTDPGDEAAARALLEATEELMTGTPVVVAALLPSSGSPALQRYATAIEEGVRAALAAPDAPANVDLAVRDDGADPGTAAMALDALESGQLVGVVGPLLDDVVRGAADARDRAVVMISPTAPAAEGIDGVYSLATPDPGAARALAEYAMASGLEQVVVLHPEEERWVFEAQAFREAFREVGGSLLRTLTYPRGATYFEEQLRTTQALHPQALVLPIPAEDIQALAPQVSFFGLDTLGIRVLGTSEWSDADMLRNVSSRHMNGVVVATPRRPGAPSEGWERFRTAYEAHFRRSLRDEIAALGWDATSLLLRALATGARTPEALRAAMEEVSGFEGATGLLSVEDGRIVREHHLVCIQDGRLVEVPPDQAAVLFRPERRGDPEKGEPERVPTGPVERYCPGYAPERAGGPPGGPRRR
jgi:ABC-type branched-subunit amino acid transport system substrate-binding protein